MTTEEQLAIAKQALLDISNPLAMLQRTKPEDTRIDGEQALIWMRDPETYKTIAREAILQMEA